MGLLRVIRRPIGHRQGLSRSMERNEELKRMVFLGLRNCVGFLSHAGMFCLVLRVDLLQFCVLQFVDVAWFC